LNRAVLLLIVPALALLLLAAHFMHAGLEPIAAVCILLVALLLLPRPWAARVVQLVLVAGVVEWVLTAVTLVEARVEQGQPYLRLVAILCGVAVFTAVAAALFQLPALRSRFGLARRTGPATDRAQSTS
jgi:hypothetical protein